MKKRILPALLALCMVISLLPVTFAAAETPTCHYAAAVGENPATECGAPTAATHNEGCPNRCTVANCNKVKNHTDAHAAAAGCTKNEQCGATSSHQAGCPKKCECTGITGKVGVADCNHSTGCTNSKAAGSDLCEDCKAKDEAAYACDGTANCKAPAGTHDHTGYGENSDQPCAKYVACGIGNCIKDKGHEGDHATAIAENGTETGIAKCLGYAADDRCSATHHIAGCPNYDCECGPHTDTGWNDGENALTCTHKAGCPLCAAWNSRVSSKVAEYNAAHKTWAEKKAVHDAWVEAGSSGTEPAQPGAEPTLDAKYVACTCKDCKPNPAMGAVTDAEGNEVDPADPTEPTTPKAEDFTDMEDWMAADVQTVLDKGWLQGEGETFNGRGVTTGATIAAALARMDGETITGTTWAQDALAWAEDKDVFEGIELTGESMARKDLVLVIWRMADKPESDFELTFTDVDGLEGDHLTAMKWAAENGIVKGNGDDTVTPDGAVNRAALCAMLARYDGLEK